MDIIPYLLGVGLTVAAMYWFLANSRRPPGTPTTGLFRYYETLEPAPPAPESLGRPTRYRTPPKAIQPPPAAPRPAAPRPAAPSVHDALAEAARALGGSGESLRPPRK